MAHQRDISYEPNRPLDSVGLRIEDGVKILKANQKGNIHPVVREEILDNPNAVMGTKEINTGLPYLLEVLVEADSVTAFIDYLADAAPEAELK